MPGLCTGLRLICHLSAPRGRSTLSHPRFTEIREHLWETLMDEGRAAEYEV